MAVSIKFISPQQQNSQYDWADISSGDNRVGKVRCRLSAPPGSKKATIIIYSINIYPEWAGKGYGREFVDYCKIYFETIVADRVRHSAIGFWEAVGFVDNHDGNWIYRKR
ncbi:MAG TPA: GNAT family N-acetyltransferase [Candidatus Wallbacteria bacterium]|nr:GNAT family N-acetyltransferase [Candidatus Wallbacteria bacterium]